MKLEAVDIQEMPINPENYLPGDRANGRGNAREDAVREASLIQMAEMLLQGEPLSECARVLGISARTARNEYAELKRRWRMKSMHVVAELHAVEMAKLDLLEKKYWESFESSKREVIVYKSTDANGRPDMEIVNVPGDARYLEGVLKVMGDRARRVGLYPDQNIRNYQREQERANGERPVFAIPEGADYLATISAVESAIRGLRDSETDNEVRTLASGEPADWSEDTDTEDM